MGKSPSVPRPEGIFHPLSYIRKTTLPPGKLQYSHIGLQSKLQRQIAECGIGSRKGKGPTKWEGPPAATAAATLISATPVISIKPIISRTNLLFPPPCPQNHPSPGQASVFSHRFAKQIAAADSRRRNASKETLCKGHIDKRRTSTSVATTSSFLSVQV